MPGHRVPIVDAQSSEQNASANQAAQNPMAGIDHSKIQEPDADEQASEKDAMSDMAVGHRHGSNRHMTMTAMRPQTPADLQKAREIVAE